MSDSQTPSSKQLIYQVLISVPQGKVVTYGQLAQLAGLGKGARIVAAALRSLPRGTKVPWHRVINAHGRISIPGQGANVQQERLEAEGVVFLSGRVNLKDYQWQP